MLLTIKSALKLNLLFLYVVVPVTESLNWLQQSRSPKKKITINKEKFQHEEIQCSSPF